MNNGRVDEFNEGKFFFPIFIVGINADENEQFSRL